jgi:hypothetical protein
MHLAIRWRLKTLPSTSCLSSVCTCISPVGLILVILCLHIYGPNIRAPTSTIRTPTKTGIATTAAFESTCSTKMGSQPLANDPHFGPLILRALYVVTIMAFWVLFNILTSPKCIYALHKRTGKQSAVFLGFGMLSTTPWQGFLIALHLIHFGLGVEIPGLSSWIGIPPIFPGTCEAATQVLGTAYNYPCQLAAVSTAWTRGDIWASLSWECVLLLVLLLLILLFFFNLSGSFGLKCDVMQEFVCCKQATSKRQLKRRYPQPAICRRCFNDSCRPLQGIERCIHGKEDHNKIVTRAREPPVCWGSFDEACMKDAKEIGMTDMEIKETLYCEWDRDAKSMLPNTYQGSHGLR